MKSLKNKVVEETIRKRIEKLKAKNRLIKTDDFTIVKLKSDYVEDHKNTMGYASPKNEGNFIDYTDKMLCRIYGTIYRYIAIDDNIFTSKGINDSKLSELSELSFNLLYGKILGIRNLELKF